MTDTEATSAATDAKSEPRPEKSRPHWAVSLLACLLILGGGAALTLYIFTTEPEAMRETQTKQTAMLVDVVSVARGAHRPMIVVMGDVEPAQDVILQPQVEGRIVERAPSFSPGGVVREGEVLLRIDQSDYRNVLRERLSDLSQAKADLQIEMGRQAVARQDYAILGEVLENEAEALVLRKPQLEAAKARVDATRAMVEQARLALERTTIEAPFDALVLRRMATIGSQASPGEELGRLVGIDEYWIDTRIPLSKLRWLSFPSESDPHGSRVRVRDHLAWAEGVFREARLYRHVGALEEETRFARVLVTVEDPLGLMSQTDGDADVPQLTIGAFVEVHIEGRELADVVRLDRDHLREADTVWVMQDGRLDIRSVRIAFQDSQYAYVSDGLADGEDVVTTNLATVAQGVRLRTGGEEAR